MEKIALITGGTRGIGYGIAEALAGEGYNLCLNGTREARDVDENLNKLRDRGIKVIYCRGNLALPEDRKNIISKVMDQFGSIHVLVNNAGIAPRERKDILEASESSFDEVMQVNLKGPYFLTQAVANIMIDQMRSDPGTNACIITITSVSAKLVSLNRGEYCISKAGLHMMTRLFAARLGAESIPVYEVSPGIIKTDMTASVKEKYERMFAEGFLLQNRWGTPEDVGRAVAMLARGDLPFSTGQVISVDGGMTIGRL